MAIFMVFYAIWLDPAWQQQGWSIFILICLYAIWLVYNGADNTRYCATLPEPSTSNETRKIAKQMQRLSIWTYTPLWIITITLCTYAANLSTPYLQ